MVSGKLKGQTLGQALARDKYAHYLMGPAYRAGRSFPLLVKWLDCGERLSLQVHPPAEAAASLGSQSKTENWYMAAAEDGANILAGLKKGVTRAQFEAAFRSDGLEELVHKISVAVGDSMFVPSGRIHAIDAGNLILEIQENSDSTYRVYDWNRSGLDGKPQQLHIEESLQCIDWDDVEPQILHPGKQGREQTLADCGSFRIRLFHLKPGEEAITLPAREQARLIHVVSGCLREMESGRLLKKGDNALLPYEESFCLQPAEETVALLTDNFSDS